ncbi:MAG: hypothetical protein DSY90_14995 [Deltaproteobacteria bacterium]|nr:MAG: hypothetical protein DSY90_14995 [Deltaproteobacteria bacterium]
MIVRQLTVLTDNSASHLGDLIARLGREGIDIRAHCFVDNGDGNCKLRMIVSNPDAAEIVLQKHHLAVVANDVVVVEVDDKPGGLGRILAIFAAGDVRIAYSYIAVSETPGTALMVFRFSNNSKAARLLKENGVKASIAGKA